jgi:RNA polymerase sigma factor (sigma-70 family)
MPNKPLNGVLKQVRKLAAIQSARLAPDYELLQQFVRSNDEAALTVLIERHGPMVLGVCRRALRCPADAEDAYQATFLVFSRKAAAIRKTASLGSWLHGVALRVAARLKRECARRKHHERSSQPPATRNPADEVSWAEVQTVLDEELQRLPERFRAVLILCYLDGKTRDEAANQLGLTPGALHGLLERGRKLLADRLTRRGLTLSAGLFGVAICEGAAGAAVSSTQVLSTAQAATLFAAGQPVGQLVSAGVLTLSQQILKGMIMTKLKLVSAALLCCMLSISAIGFTFAQSEPAYRIAVPVQVDGSTNSLLTGKDTDEAFIRRVSQDLRGVEPTPAEIHFFVTSKEAKKREKVVDLFIAEREAKKKNQKRTDAEAMYAEVIRSLEAATFAEAYAEFAKAYTTNLAKDPAKKPAPPSSPELALLKTNVELAKLAVREKEILLVAAREKTKDLKGDELLLQKTQLELLEIDLRRARLLLEQAVHALSAAEKHAEKKSSGK